MNDSKQKHYFVQCWQLSVHVFTVLSVVTSALSSRSSCVKFLSPCVHASIRHDKPSCKISKPNCQAQQVEAHCYCLSIEREWKTLVLIFQEHGWSFIVLEAKLIHQLHGKNKSKNKSKRWRLLDKFVRRAASHHKTIQSSNTICVIIRCQFCSVSITMNGHLHLISC